MRMRVRHFKNFLPRSSALLSFTTRFDSRISATGDHKIHVFNRSLDSGLMKVAEWNGSVLTSPRGEPEIWECPVLLYGFSGEPFLKRERTISIFTSDKPSKIRLD
jgi:hypothetical protein